MEINELLDMITSSYPKDGYVEIDSLFGVVYVKENLTKEELKLVANSINLKKGTSKFDMLVQDKYGYNWNYFRNKRDFDYFNAMYAVLMHSKFIEDCFSVRFSFSVMIGAEAERLGGIESNLKSDSFKNNFSISDVFKINYDEIGKVIKIEKKGQPEIDSFKAILDVIREVKGRSDVDTTLEENLLNYFKDARNYDTSVIESVIKKDPNALLYAVVYYNNNSISIDELYKKNETELFDLLNSISEEIFSLDVKATVEFVEKVVTFMAMLNAKYKGKGLQ